MLLDRICRRLARLAPYAKIMVMVPMLRSNSSVVHGLHARTGIVSSTFAVEL